MNGRCQMQPGKGKRFGQVSLALRPSAALARVDLQHHVTGEVPLGQVLQYPPGLLVTPPRYQMLVFDRPCPIGEMDVPQAGAPRTNEINRLLVRSRSVREIQRQIVIVELGGIPAGDVRLELAARGTPGIHVLDRQQDAGALSEPPNAVDEASGVVALPAAGRMDYDHIGVPPARRLDRSLQLRPRISSPDPLGDQQAWRVDR